MVEGLVDVASEDAVGPLDIDCCNVGIGSEMDEGGEGTGSIVELSVEATELSCFDVCSELDDAEATGSGRRET